MNEEEMQKEETSPLLIKREPVDENDIKDYAETTMNELLGWYGYGKVDSRDTQGLNLHRFTATSSPPPCQLIDGEDGDSSLELARNNSASPTSSNNGGSSKTDQSNLPAGYIVCAWCQKVGMKLFTLKTASGQKAFCSELCFTQCRRASFKKNKVCDWCKHIRHTVNYVDFQDGEQQLQFCSDKCLNQYKMNIFCKETQAHLQMHPHLQDAAKLAAAVAAAGGGSSTANREGVTLITPDLWLRDCHGSHDSLNGQDANKTDGSSSSTKYDEIIPPTPIPPTKTKEGVSSKRSSRDKNSSSSHNNRSRHHHHHHHHHHHRNAPSSSVSKSTMADVVPDPLPKSTSPIPPTSVPSLIPPQLLAAAAAALAAAPPSSHPNVNRPPFNPFLPPIPFHSDLLRLPRLGGGNNPPQPPFLIPPGLGLPSDLGAHPQNQQSTNNNNNNNNNNHSNNSNNPSAGPPPRLPPSFLSPFLNSLLPPMAVLVPYPVVLPIPLPIPIPLPFPVPANNDKSGEANMRKYDKSHEKRNGGNLSGKTRRGMMGKWYKKGSGPVFNSMRSSVGNKRVESVITRLPKIGESSPSRGQMTGSGCAGRNALCRVGGSSGVGGGGDSSSSNGLDGESSDLSDFPDSDTGMDLGEEDDTDEEEEELGENTLPVGVGVGDAGKVEEGKSDGKSVGLLPMFSSQEKSNTFSRERIDESEPELKRKCVRTRLTAK